MSVQITNKLSTEPANVSLVSFGTKAFVYVPNTKTWTQLADNVSASPASFATSAEIAFVHLMSILIRMSAFVMKDLSEEPAVVCARNMNTLLLMDLANVTLAL